MIQRYKKIISWVRPVHEYKDIYLLTVSIGDITKLLADSSPEKFISKINQINMLLINQIELENGYIVELNTGSIFAIFDNETSPETVCLLAIKLLDCIERDSKIFPVYLHVAISTGVNCLCTYFRGEYTQVLGCSVNRNHDLLRTINKYKFNSIVVDI